MNVKKKQFLSSGRAQPSPTRRTANYHPSIWNDGYVQSLPDSMDSEQFDFWEKLKEETRHLVQDKHDDTIELLELLDSLRQLGVSYHYESQIKNLLSSISSSLSGSLENILKKNLHGSALLFRLLREYGIQDQESLEVLINLISETGMFGVDTVTDVKGMVSLYEASYLASEGEHELEEAREFTTKQLNNYLKEPSLKNLQLVEEIKHALELPLHWRMPRLHTRWFIDAYGKQESMNPGLLLFAKLDFNMLQCLYKKELKELSRWWKNHGLVGDEFNFARDRLAENYLWSVGCTFEPQYWRCRKEITKLGCLLTTIDDIYDIYGSLEELELFTNAVIEWKISATLPRYMKITLTVLFTVINAMSLAVSMDKELDILPFLKQVWGDLCKSYLVEAIWYYSEYTPTLNEYLENAWLTITGPVLLYSAYCLSEDLTEEALKSLELNSDVVRYSSMIARLYDDLGTSMLEIRRGDVPKSIQCRMNDTNVSESVARDDIRCLIRRYWKALNGEQIARFNFEESFNRYVLNFPRMAQSIYQHGDGHGESKHETRNRIISLLVNPITI